MMPVAQKRLHRDEVPARKKQLHHVSVVTASEPFQPREGSDHVSRNSFFDGVSPLKSGQRLGHLLLVGCRQQSLRHRIHIALSHQPIQFATRHERTLHASHARADIGAK